MSKDEFLDRFQKYKEQIIKATVNSILESTIQFFTNNKKGEASATASGVLITLANKYFMLTAAHVIAESYNDIFIILPDKELQLGGLLYFTPIPANGLRKDDKIDLAIMELEDKVVAEILSSFKFISLNNIEIGHRDIQLPYYLSVGYPVSKTKRVWRKAELSAAPYPYQTEPCSGFDYKKFGFSSISHIAVKFSGKVVSLNNKNLHKAPALNGISGSGLWFLKNFATPKTVTDKQLIGLVIEQVNQNGNQAIVATRIDLVTEFIRQHFSVDIPKSKTVKVKNNLNK